MTKQLSPRHALVEGNSKATGEETEARILHEFISYGYSVSLPFGDNDKYDLVIDNDGELYRIQCKTGWTTKNGTMRFNTHSQTTRGGTYHESTYEGEIDAFVVRYPANETLYWVDIEDATNQKMELRFTSANDHPAINWAADFEFDGEIP